MKCLLILFQNRIYVTEEDGKPLAEFENAPYGRGWKEARDWMREHSYVHVASKQGRLSTAPTKPGFYKHSMLSWLPIQKEEYYQLSDSLNSNCVLLHISKAKQKTNLVCLVKSGAWLELRKDNFILRSVWIGDRKKVEPELQWLRDWAEERGYEIGNDPKYGFNLSDYDVTPPSDSKGGQGDEGPDLPGEADDGSSDRE